MRNKTAPPTQKHQSKPLNPRDGLIAKKKKQKQSVKESCVLDNHSHRTRGHRCRLRDRVDRMPAPRHATLMPIMETKPAIIFDLYGTLLSAPPSTLHREIPRALGVSARKWLEHVRDTLLLRPFASAEELIHFTCERLAPGSDTAREARCVEIIRHEIARVELLPGVVSLLSFLKHRGFRLGLLSNLSSTYKEPIERFGLEKLFDAMFFSCDEGISKPVPEAYLETARRLGVAPREILFVGDSVPNDVDAPSALGMRTIHVGSDGPRAVGETHLVGLMDLSGEASRPMLRVGDSVQMPASRASVRSIVPVSDDEQGRYNLVYRVETDCADAPVSFVKRFLLPESAHVEEMAYRVHALVGLPTCRVSIIDAGEPLLAMTEAAGHKYDEAVDADLAWELGRHMAFAYVFSNGDIRPRNAFLSRANGRPEVTMVDLEHCFFNLAIDPSGLDDPFDPECLDAHPDLHVVKQVLTDRAMRRARRSFIQEEDIPAETYVAFKDGFRGFFGKMSAMRHDIVGFIDERIHRKPYLVLGTHSYRRAMASVDVREIGDRLTHDPDHVISRFC
jgi:HAD superfamily hydrolase (TIGR01509 family)